MKKQLIFYIIMLSLFLFFGCGSRKVQKSSSEIDYTEKLQAASSDSLISKIDTQAGTTTTDYSKQLDFNLEPIDKTKPATYTDNPTPSGGRKITVENGKLTVNEQTNVGQTIDTSRTNQFAKQWWEKEVDKFTHLDKEEKFKFLESIKNNPWPWLGGAGALVLIIWGFLVYKRSGG